jgi:hypothetical protein
MGGQSKRCAMKKRGRPQKGRPDSSEEQGDSDAVGKVWRAHRCTTKFYFVVDKNQDSCPVRRKQIEVFFKTSHIYHGVIGFNPPNNFKSRFAIYNCPGQTPILVSEQKM